MKYIFISLILALINLNAIGESVIIKPFDNKPKVSLTAPDTKKAIPGTPFYRTIGTNGMAIQCKYPYNRTCIMFVSKFVDISNEIPCMGTIGSNVPVQGELIEPNTVHMGIYNEMGALVYREITNTPKEFNCQDGIFEIIFPNGY